MRNDGVSVISKSCSSPAVSGLNEGKLPSSGASSGPIGGEPKAVRSLATARSFGSKGRKDAQPVGIEQSNQGGENPSMAARKKASKKKARKAKKATRKKARRKKR